MRRRERGWRAGLVSAVIVLLTLNGCGGGADRGEQVRQLDPAPRPFDVLNPYGEWTSLPGRGEVWRPHVGYEWSPFSQGQWAWTDRGWMWVSDEPFGWVVYHYGFWDYQPGMGWIWEPGYDWSPARVSWFVSDRYIGWAPLPPPGVLLPRPGEETGGGAWSVVPTREFMRSRVGSYRTSDFPRGGGTTGNAPPDVRAVESSSGSSIPLSRIETERVKAGTHELLRVRTRSDDPRGAVPPPRPLPEPQPMDLPTGRARGQSNPPASSNPPNQRPPSSTNQPPQQPPGGAKRGGSRRTNEPVGASGQPTPPSGVRPSPSGKEKQVAPEDTTRRGSTRDRTGNNRSR